VLTASGSSTSVATAQSNLLFDGSTLNVLSSVSAATLAGNNLSVAGTISATTGVYVGTVSATTLSGPNHFGANLSMTGTISATTGVYVGTVSATTLSGPNHFGANLSMTGTISATTGVYVGTVSAATVLANNLSVSGTISGTVLSLSTSATTGLATLTASSSGTHVAIRNTTTATGGGRLLELLMPNIPGASGNQASLFVGKNLNPSNYGAIRYNHLQDASANNYIALTPGDATVGVNVIQSGFVGIGTVTPQTRLDVGGTISAATLSVAGTISAAAVRASNICASTILRVVNDGSAVSPAIVVGGDISTGYYRPSANALAIATAGVKTANFSNNIIEFSNSGVQALWLSNSQLQAATGSVNVPSYTFAVDVSTGFFRAGAGQVAFTTGGAQRAVFSNSTLGIGVATPQSAVDVSGAVNASAGAAAPSIIAGSWNRFSGSNVMFARGIVALRGNVVQWPTYLNTMNANLMAFSNDATYGTWIQFLKSGIWSIDYQGAVAAGAFESYMSVSTVSTYTTYGALAALSSMLLFGRSEASFGGGKYTGYIQSNSTYYYKLFINAAVSNISFWNLRICFLGETNTSPTYPILP
jgi:hypothetical protein